jgi:endonuclease III
LRKKFEVEFSVDDVKASKIAERLLDHFYNRKGFFEDYSMPEYVLPRNLEEGSREHALFLSYVISIDYMTNAVKLWKKSRGAYELYPERFTPKEILNVSQRTVENYVKKLGARFYSNAAKTWIKVSRLLVDKYGGDPRNITREPLEIADIKKRLQEFPYLRGNKLSNFYLSARAKTKGITFKENTAIWRRQE